MHGKNLLTPTNIRQANYDLTVETPRTQQRRVQHVRAVSGGNDNDAVVHFKAVHLYQQLVESLLTLVMTTAHTGTTMTTNGVDLIDKDNARRMLLGLFEHVANTARTNTDKHLNKVGTGNGEERHLSFTRNRFCQQGFTGTWRADHQHATGNATTQALKLAWVTQELNQLTDLFLGFVATGNVSESGFNLIFREQARLALTEAHRAALTARTALHLAHEEHDHSDHYQNREAGHQQLRPDALLLRLLADDGNVIVHQILDQAVVGNRRTNDIEGIAIDTLGTDQIAIDGDFLDLTFLYLLDELGIIEFVRLRRTGEIVHHRD